VVSSTNESEIAEVLPRADAQVFPRVFDQMVAMAALGALLLVGVGGPLLWEFAGSDYVESRDLTLEQPVQFSHRHHVAEIGLDCRYCHNGVDKSSFAGIPATNVCMTCHSQLFTDSKMLEPVRRSYSTNTPIHWQRVHHLPDYVYFNHGIHVSKGVSCVSCHGRVDQMALVRQVKPLTMGWCLDCHRNPGPNLRPEDRVYDLGWQRPKDPELDKRLLEEYHIRPKGLTECSVCHR
jgi:hypothetical protein